MLALTGIGNQLRQLPQRLALSVGQSHRVRVWATVATAAQRRVRWPVPSTATTIAFSAARIRTPSRNRRHRHTQFLCTAARKSVLHHPQAHADVSHVSIRTKEHTPILPLDAPGRHSGLAEPRTEDLTRHPVARRLEREGVGRRLHVLLPATLRLIAQVTP
jgi:hypothetical protein